MTWKWGLGLRAGVLEEVICDLRGSVGLDLRTSGRAGKIRSCR